MQSDLPGSLERHDRVRAHSARGVNAKLDDEAARRVHALTTAGRAAVVRRVGELDREWDVDRALLANFAVVGGATFAMGVRELRRRRGGWNGWLTFFSVQLGFMLVHATRGWCPPLPVFRRLGFRSGKEIDAERELVVGRLRAGDAAAAQRT